MVFNFNRHLVPIFYKTVDCYLILKKKFTGPMYSHHLLNISEKSRKKCRRRACTDNHDQWPRSPTGKNLLSTSITRTQ